MRHLRRLALVVVPFLGACMGEVGGDDDPSALVGDGAPSDDAASKSDDAPSSDTAATSDTTSPDAPPSLDTGTPTSDTGSAPDAVATDTAADTGPAPTDAAPDTVIVAGPSSTRQTAHPLGTTGAPNGFYEYLPPGYAKGGAPTPLLVFWHGLGEDGDGSAGQLSKVLVNGPPKLIGQDKWPNARPWIVLSPQNPSGCPSAASIKAFLDWALANYTVDAARIHLTGLSCGAIGVWDYLRAHGATTPIATAVPIAGTGNGAWDTLGCGLGRVAIWAFHGSLDGTVAPSGTTVPMTGLLACPSPPRRDAKMTLYDGVGHDSWTRTYDLSAGNDIYAWMLANHR